MPGLAIELSEKINVFLHIHETADERETLLIRTCAEYNGQSDVEDFPVYLGQKWRTTALELTCWVDDDSINIEIVGSTVGRVRRKYQISDDEQHLLLTTTLDRNADNSSDNEPRNEISCNRYFIRRLPLF